ncbi:MAG: peptidoglycan DD-metalloendopeptidase family protein [Desulfuromonadaceae bacterium]|nr:peptidoglycan DD-metalloendopeptidase family protein [Desulfuromonadaceae bacterium]
MNLRRTQKNTGKQPKDRNLYELPSTRKRKVARRRQGLVLFLLMAAIAVFLYFVTRDKTLYEPAIHEAEDVHILSPAAFEDPLPQAIIETRRETISCAVESGETITALLGHYFTPAEILIIAQKAKPIFPLHKLCAGHQYSIELENEEFISFKYDIDTKEQLIIEKKDGEINVERKPIPYDIKIESVGTQVESSLFGSVASIGESSELALDIMNIFAWDIDFIRDIRSGDYFNAVVEKRYRNGKLEGYGNVLAAHFNNQGDDYFAFYYANGEASGHYNERGESLRKAFLKAPLSYTRISSGYTNRRYHPVLNEWRPHLAVDYAAPTGTPVKAIAEGTVVGKSYDSNNGNMIRLRHPNSYESTYIHLSKFGREIKKGSRVKQGDIIGYVGSTGLATGPHLDFRIFKNGTPINPLKLKSTPTQPVPTHARAEFDSLVAQMRQKLVPETDKGSDFVVSSTAALEDKANKDSTL